MGTREEDWFGFSKRELKFSRIYSRAQAQLFHMINYSSDSRYDMENWSKCVAARKSDEKKREIGKSNH